MTADKGVPEDLHAAGVVLGCNQNHPTPTFGVELPSDRADFVGRVPVSISDQVNSITRHTQRDEDLAAVDVLRRPINPEARQRKILLVDSTLRQPHLARPSLLINDRGFHGTEWQVTADHDDRPGRLQWILNDKPCAGGPEGEWRKDQYCG